MKLYVEGEKLKDKEFLLKTRNGQGFLTKLNADGSIPKRFASWAKVPIYVHTEDYAKGWKVVSYRSTGYDSFYVILKHPNGFSLEVSMGNFLTLIMSVATVVKGRLSGAWRWESKNLIKGKQKKTKEEQEGW